MPDILYYLDCPGTELTLPDWLSKLPLFSNQSLTSGITSLSKLSIKLKEIIYHISHSHQLFTTFPYPLT